jgi:adenylate kinase
MGLGALVPDSTVWEMVRERFACLQCGGEFILDGFPRTLGQAECIKQLMDGEGLTLAAVVNHQLPARGIVTRLGGHRSCDQWINARRYFI